MMYVFVIAVNVLQMTKMCTFQRNCFEFYLNFIKTCLNLTTINNISYVFGKG